jgi:predicted DNA-binding transcriptional regulator AlpA
MARPPAKQRQLASVPQGGDGEERIAAALHAIQEACGVLSEHILGRRAVLVKRDEVARRLGVPESWVKREQEAGRLPFAHRLGTRKWVYNDAELDDFIARLGEPEGPGG